MSTNCHFTNVVSTFINADSKIMTHYFMQLIIPLNTLIVTLFELQPLSGTESMFVFAMLNSQYVALILHVV